MPWTPSPPLFLCKKSAFMMHFYMYCMLSAFSTQITCVLLFFFLQDKSKRKRKRKEEEKTKKRMNAQRETIQSEKSSSSSSLPKKKNSFFFHFGFFVFALCLVSCEITLLNRTQNKKSKKHNNQEHKKTHEIIIKATIQKNTKAPCSFFALMIPKNVHVYKCIMLRWATLAALYNQK